MLHDRNFPQFTVRSPHPCVSSMPHLHASFKEERYSMPIAQPSGCMSTLAHQSHSYATAMPNMASMHWQIAYTCSSVSHTCTATTPTLTTNTHPAAHMWLMCTHPAHTITITLHNHIRMHLYTQTHTTHNTGCNRTWSVPARPTASPS